MLILPQTKYCASPVIVCLRNGPISLSLCHFETLFHYYSNSTHKFPVKIVRFFLKTSSLDTSRIPSIQRFKG